VATDMAERDGFEGAAGSGHAPTVAGRDRERSCRLLVVLHGRVGIAGGSFRAWEFTTVRIDTRHLAEEATLLERRSRTYVLITGMTILFAAFGFIWLTW
jgi:hypothetical protein